MLALCAKELAELQSVCPPGGQGTALGSGILGQYALSGAGGVCPSGSVHGGQWGCASQPSAATPHTGPAGCVRGPAGQRVVAGGGPLCGGDTGTPLLRRRLGAPGNARLGSQGMAVLQAGLAPAGGGGQPGCWQVVGRARKPLALGQGHPLSQRKGPRAARSVGRGAGMCPCLWVLLAPSCVSQGREACQGGSATVGPGRWHPGAAAWEGPQGSYSYGAAQGIPLSASRGR